VDTVAIGITTQETKRSGEREPAVTSFPRVTLRLRFEVTDVAPNGDISFVWEAEEAKLEPAEGTPPAVREAMREVAERIEGRSGSGRQTAQGLNLHLRHDTPPPEEAEVQPLFGLLCEIVQQVSTPLPKDPVGAGARWEVTNAKYPIEGMRITQTVTYELDSLDEDEARLRMFVALIGPNQEFAHPEIPAEADARLVSAHGDGEGELHIAFDRLGERSFRMSVESRAVLSVMDGEEERELSVVRKLRYETERE
jgi:hypothetical protein